MPIYCKFPFVMSQTPVPDGGIDWHSSVQVEVLMLVYSALQKDWRQVRRSIGLSPHIPHSPSETCLCFDNCVSNHCNTSRQLHLFQAKDAMCQDQSETYSAQSITSITYSLPSTIIREGTFAAILDQVQTPQRACELLGHDIVFLAPT